MDIHDYNFEVVLSPNGKPRLWIPGHMSTPGYDSYFIPGYWAYKHKLIDEYNTLKNIQVIHDEGPEPDVLEVEFSKTGKPRVWIPEHLGTTKHWGTYTISGYWAYKHRLIEDYYFQKYNGLSQDYWSEYWAYNSNTKTTVNDKKIVRIYNGKQHMIKKRRTK
jgi:hypothetical protein